MFTPPELTDYLHEHIPVSAAMGLQVDAVEWNTLRLRFPLVPNLNHNSTAFGGSLSSALMLAGWSLVHARLRHLNYDTILVVSKSETKFTKPVDGDFVAICEHDDEDDWQFFRDCLEQRGRAKLRVKTRVELGEVVSATMSGAFVAIDRNEARDD